MIRAFTLVLVLSLVLVPMPTMAQPRVHAPLLAAGRLFCASMYAVLFIADMTNDEKGRIAAMGFLEAFC